MPPPETWSLMPAVVLSCVTVVELFIRLPFMNRIEAVNSGALKALGIVRSPRISDHWKEKVLPHYAGQIMLASLGLGSLLLLCALAFMSVYLLCAWWPLGDIHTVLESLGLPSVQWWLLGVSLLYVIIRARLGRSGQ
ncbi:MAG: hypothetical protein GQ538_07545, partial [Xanthomonadales bacterium]|nr:hypothetical protein [Xanthomonadales bacterium]